MLFPVLVEEYEEVISSEKSWGEVGVWGMFNQIDNKDKNTRPDICLSSEGGFQVKLKQIIPPLSQNWSDYYYSMIQ